MFRKIFAVMFSLTLVLTTLGVSTVHAQSRAEASSVERVRAQIIQRGTGERARIEVKLRDNSKLKGYISETGADSFTLTEKKTGTVRTIAYGDVARVGDGGSSQTKYIIIGAAAVAAAVVLFAARGAFCDGQC